MCNVEQSAQAALDEFDLEFTQLGRAPPGVDFADVYCQFRTRAVLKGQLAGGTPDHGLADELKRRAVHAANDLLSDRCVRNRFEKQPPARSRVLHLANLRQTAMLLWLGLDGLYPTPPVAPVSERNSCLLQRMIRGVEIMLLSVLVFGRPVTSFNAFARAPSWLDVSSSRRNFSSISLMAECCQARCKAIG